MALVVQQINSQRCFEEACISPRPANPNDQRPRPRIDRSVLFWFLIEHAGSPPRTFGSILNPTYGGEMCLENLKMFDTS